LWQNVAGVSIDVVREERIAIKGFFKRWRLSPAMFKCIDTK
jgi:hypothetical protein